MLNPGKESQKNPLARIGMYLLALALTVGLVGVLIQPAPERPLGEPLLTVNEKVITVDQFLREHQALESYYRRQMGEAFDQLMAQGNFDIKQIALNSLETRALAYERARTLGFTLSEKDLRHKIVNYAVTDREGNKVFPFHVDGEFDVQAYKDNLRIPVADFEDNIRSDYLFNNMRMLIANAVEVSAAETRESYRYKNDKIEVEYAVFDSADEERYPPPDEKDVRAYFTTHRADFVIPETRKARYVEIAAEEFARTAEPSPEALQRHYDAIKDAQFATTPKQVCASHILIKTADTDTPEAIEAARKRAQDIADDLQAGKLTFAEAASQYSEGPTKDRAGALGCFGPGAMVPPFEKAAFALAPGDMTPTPVKTRFGWHLISVERIEEGEYKPLDTVRADVIEDWKTTRGSDLAREAAARMAAAVRQGASFADAAKKEGLTVVETDFVRRSDPTLGDVEGATRLIQTLFELEAGGVSDPIRLVDDIYVVELVEIREAHEAAFEEARDDVWEAATKVHREMKAQNEAEDVLAALRGGSEIQDLAKKRDFQVLTTGLFPQSDMRVPEIGGDPELLTTLFSLTEDNRSPDTIYTQAGRHIVFQLKTRERVDAEELENALPSERKQVLGERQADLFTSWQSTLKGRFPIDLKEDLYAGL